MPDSINQKVVAWAHGKLKKRVGRGECWDLADQALRHAGARSSTTTGANDDYQWGSEMPVIAAMPGDVLQFRDYVVTTTTVTNHLAWARRTLRACALDRLRGVTASEPELRAEARRLWR